MNSNFHHTPYIVCPVICNLDFIYLNNKNLDNIDFLEFRMDLLLENNIEEYEIIDYIKKYNIKKILTVRSHSQSGVNLGNVISDNDRISIYFNYLKYVDYVDVEIDSLSSLNFKNFSSKIHSKGKKIIASHHDFNSFPGIKNLKDKIEMTLVMNIDVIKIAVVVNSIDDVFDLVKLLRECIKKKYKVSIMGMGKYGMLSRLILAKEGSFLNYAYLEKSNAPGQWSSDELKSIISRI